MLQVLSTMFVASLLAVGGVAKFSTPKAMSDCCVGNCCDKACCASACTCDDCAACCGSCCK